MAKDNKGKKGKKKGAARGRSVDGAVEEREPGAPEAWVGRGVKLRHPVNMNGSFAVGSSAGLLEEAGERGGPVEEGPEVLLPLELHLLYLARREGGLAYEGYSVVCCGGLLIASKLSSVTFSMGWRASMTARTPFFS